MSSASQAASPAPENPITSTVHQLAENRATTDTPFIAPSEPTSSTASIAQRADFFQNVSTVKDDSSNFVMFKSQWFIAINAAGIGHLFTKEFDPPMKPDPNEIALATAFADALKVYTTYTHLESQAQALLTGHLTERTMGKVMKNATRVYDVWVKLVEEIQVKSEVHLSQMKEDWEMRVCPTRGDVHQFLDDDDKIVEDIKDAGGEFSDTELHAHILKVISQFYCNHAHILIEVAAMQGKTLPTDVLTLLIKCFYDQNKGKHPTAMSAEARDVALTSDEPRAGPLNPS